MRRREFITVLGGAAVWPLAARAQQPGGMRRIGVLIASAADDLEHQARMAAFLQGLAQLLERRPQRASAPSTAVTLRLTCRLGADETVLSGLGSRPAAMFICASVAIAKTPKLEPITLEPAAARLLTKP